MQVLVLTGDHLILHTSEADRIKRAVEVRDGLIRAGLYQAVHSSSDRTPAESGISNNVPPVNNDRWRIGTSPFPISREDLDFINALGKHLLSFYQCVNRLYFDSLRGDVPHWVAEYLDRGKPESVIEYGRMKRFKQDVPGIIRPDLIPTETGMIATELDAVPGGMGLTAGLSSAYASLFSYPATVGEKTLVGEADGIVAGFEAMLRSRCGNPDPLIAIVVSEESASYRAEMVWLAKALNAHGLTTFVLEPREVGFSDGELWLEHAGEKRKIDLIYRFFELFDLKNIPKSELMLYAAKKKQVVLTPPAKAFFEEKLLHALFHHPVLKSFWCRHLGEETFSVLEKVFPRTWIMDPQTLPPHATIPGLTLAGEAVQDFRQLHKASKKGRQYAVKPSGFSELAWGSRGVSIGHDLSEGAWQAVIDNALDSFQTTPYILQEFHKGKKVSVEYVDFEREELRTMRGRVRLSPYYFVEGKEVQLGGILATVCSLEKKLIHGMVDAVMVPCSVTR